jgi:RND superfamily putative drug exporter
MVGLGVGIDYALFVVTRHRECLASGDDVVTAAATATATAGKAVLFAGGTVMVAICGLWFVNVPLLASIGFGVAIVVAVSVAAALTLLPALLGLCGSRLATTRSRRRWFRRAQRAGSGSAQPSVTKRPPLAARWADHVGRHPARFAVLSLAVLLLLAAPVLSLRLGWADAGNEPTSTTQRRAYDLTTEAFGPGANGPILVAVDLSKAADDDAVLERLSTAMVGAAGVATVLPPERNRSGDTAVLTVVPTTGPESDRTSELVERLRGETIPPVVAGTGAAAHLTGPTAVLVDLTQRLSDRLLIFIGVVVAASFVLLVVLFRSVVVPLKAAIMNLLSIGAAYGVLVAVFQWGWGAELLGLDGPVPVTAFVPVMVFAIVFGLSMDYEVFLLSRIREEYDRTGDPHRSVVDGLGATGRVITCAALVMIAVFVSFAMSSSVSVKMMGIGLATAVLVDATIIRLVLVPSSMAILGRANWWLPRWLDRLLPSTGFDHHGLDHHGPDTDAGESEADVIAVGGFVVDGSGGMDAIDHSNDDAPVLATAATDGR